MKIMHLNLCRGPGGSSRLVADMANGQTEMGHEVTVLDPLGRHTRDALNPSTQYRRVPRLFAGPLLRWHLHRIGPDIIHVHQGKAARVANKVKGETPLVATLHGTYTAKSFARCDGIARVADHQIAEMDCYRGPSTTISNWLVSSNMEPLSKAAARAQLGLPDDEFIFGFVGRLASVKGINDLLSAFGAIKSPDCTLSIIGDGSMRGLVDKASKADPRIYFHGHRADAQQLMAAFDCLVLPSHAESFGLVLLEAFAAGCPVIATKTKGALEVLDGSGARTVPIGDVPKLTDAMSEERQVPSNLDFGKTLKRYQRQTQIERTLDFYAHLTERA